jgi:hypothetical protein
MAVIICAQASPRGPQLTIPPPANIAVKPRAIAVITNTLYLLKPSRRIVFIPTAESIIRKVAAGKMNLHVHLNLSNSGTYL